ncbi:MAG: hypothetical protein AAF514_13600, partial [Verrucomicrobiota bacterium]
RFAIDAISRSATGVTLSWQAEAGATYEVEFTTDLSGNWEAVSDAPLSGEGLLEFTDADLERGGVGIGFYRIRTLSQ